MPSIYDVKPAFQNLLRPLSDSLARKHVTPNQVTIAAMLLSLMAGLLLAFFPTSRVALLLIPITLLIRMMLNAIDGMLAREHAMQSPLGTFLNELGDVFSDTFLYLPFCLVPGVSSVLIVIVVILGIIAEMTGVVAIQAGAARRYDGPMGKSDRAVVFGALGLFLALGFHASIGWVIILLLVLLLLVITVVNRVINALSEVKDASTQ